MRRRDGKLFSHGHWKCSWREEKGMTKGQEPVWKGCPGDQTKGQLGKPHNQKGARAWPQTDRKREGIVGPEPIMRKWGHIEKCITK